MSTFQEQFPSLKDKIHFIGVYGDKTKCYGITLIDIENHCLDKQKVRELLDKRIRIYEEEYSRNAINQRGHIAASTGAELNIIKKELGLNDSVFGLPIKVDKNLKPGEWNIKPTCKCNGSLRIPSTSGRICLNCGGYI